MTEYFKISGIFLQLIWRILTILTEHFKISGIFQRFSVLMRRSFPTIFHQLYKIKSSITGTRSFVLWNYNLLLYYCATLSFMLRRVCLQYLILRQSMSYFVSTVLIVFTFVSAVFSFISTLFTFVNSVFFFVRTVFFFVSTLGLFTASVNTVFFFVSTVLPYISTVIYFVSTQFTFINTL